MLKNYKYYLENLDCANCAKKIENAISEDERFQNVIVNFNTLTISFKNFKTSSLELLFTSIKSLLMKSLK